MNPRPPVLRANYFENDPTLRHYSTLSGFTSIAKEFQIKNRYNLFIPISKTIESQEWCRNLLSVIVVLKFNL
jgi:hypothetical protein